MNMRKITLLLVALLCPYISLFSKDIVLNGLWETGINRNYNRSVRIPSISEDPKEMTNGTVWFKKEIVLPKGEWTQGTLILKGARFAPEVYINGERVSSTEGGMAPTFHLLQHEEVKPGNSILLEIALKSLRDIPETDASYIPKADHWRSNISSCIWDDVILKLHGDVSIESVIPYIFQEKGEGKLKVSLNGFRKNSNKLKAELCIVDTSGNSILKKQFKINQKITNLNFALDQLQKWTPETPNLYHAKLKIWDKNILQDEYELNLANRSFKVSNKQFYLNGKPCKIRAGTVVWHRWMRDKEGTELGFNEQWFLENVVKRLKSHGANTLRFHLGNPPERFLDMCDKHGLLVQYEWSFFHGMPASKESLIKQWRNWLDLGMRHPSVVLIHPYNETQGKQLEIAWSALDELLPDYPQLVLADRDVIHVHKYWWSLFENLGLYYDSYKQFPKAIMVDEFGGNYLDGEANVGGYKTAKSAYLRFLGKNHNKTERLQHLSESNAKVAEYWRRIDAAGFSPFTILGSYEDGNHWYMGRLKNGEPKPVWEALTAAWSPISVSLDLWDRNFFKNQTVKIPLHLFNDLGTNADVSITFGIKMGSHILNSQTTRKMLPSYSHQVDSIKITCPNATGEYTIFAELKSPDLQIEHSVISSWNIRILELQISNTLAKKSICTFPNETELNQFLKDITIKKSENKPDILIGSTNTWKQIEQNDKEFLSGIEKKINQGTSVILLDIGPRFYGQANLVNDLGPLQGKYRVKKAKGQHISLPFGIQINFTEISEPESHIHPAKNSSLWKNLPKDANWLWNGKRGGLIVPATDMKISGLSQKGFLELWKTRGADCDKICKQSYFAYNLQGFYAYSNSINDRKVKKSLREKVKFLVEDAPSLQNAINPNAKIEVINLSEEYQNSKDGIAEELIPLAVCGGSHEKVPVILINFGKDKGKLILSQLLTNDRLYNPTPNHKAYATKADQATRQVIINMLELVSSK